MRAVNDWRRALSNSILTSEQVSKFAKDGIVVLEGFYDIDKDIKPIQQGIYDVIGQVMRRHHVNDDRSPFSKETFDVGYQKLIGQNRAWGGEVYDAVKQIPSFMRIVSNYSNEMIVKELRRDSIPGLAAGGYGIRIDNPNEDKFRAMWHQEYPAQLRSLDGIVFWSPLVDVTEELGPVVVCPGSHREGPLPVFDADPDSAKRTGAYALMLHRENEILSRYNTIAPRTSPGDLILMDFLLLHASGRNVGKRSRWSMQFRYFNFAEETGRSHGWKGSYAAGVDFKLVHPELFVGAPRG
jgi:Phytanoyl-CoA dioxygenase (PhyH)